MPGHLEVAEQIAAGRADAGLTLRVAAEAFGLSFTTLREERYDLVIPRREIDSPAVKVLLEALSSSRLASEVSRLCLYDTSEMGKVAARSGDWGWMIRSDPCGSARMTIAAGNRRPSSVRNSIGRFPESRIPESPTRSGLRPWHPDKLRRKFRSAWP